MTKYRIVPSRNLEWAIQYTNNGMHWAPVKDLAGYPKVYATETAAENGIKQEIEYYKQSQRELAHLETPPREYP